jgi:hypothetical protein
MRLATWNVNFPGFWNGSGTADRRLVCEQENETEHATRQQVAAK